MDTFKNLSKDISSTTTKILQKTGFTEKTVDPEFEEYRSRMDGLLKWIIQVDKDVRKQEEQLLQMGSLFGLLSNSYTSVCSDSFEKHTYGIEFSKTNLEIQYILREYQDRQKILFLKLEEFKEKLLTNKKLIQNQDNLCLEYDKWKTSFIKNVSHSENLNSKQKEISEKYEKSKFAYNTAHLEALKEMKRIYSSRFESFQVDYKLYVTIQIELFSKLSLIYKQLVTSSFNDLPVSPPTAETKDETSEEVSPLSSVYIHKEEETEKK